MKIIYENKNYKEIDLDMVMRMEFYKLILDDIMRSYIRHTV